MICCVSGIKSCWNRLRKSPGPWGRPKRTPPFWPRRWSMPTCTATSTHGLSRLAVYVRRIRQGLIDPKAPCRFERVRPCSLVVDACNGLGQVQAMKTLRELEPLAEEFGAAVAAIRNSGHFGALSWYCDQAAERDMILLAVTNCEPSMAPTGGRAPFFGTNPIAAAFPTGKGFNLSIDLAHLPGGKGQYHRRP